MKENIFYKIFNKFNLNNNSDLNKLIFSDKQSSFNLDNKYNLSIKKWNVDKIKCKILITNQKIKLNKDDKLNLNVTTSYGFYSAKCLITEYEVKKNHILCSLKILEPLHRIEKRKFYRLNDKLDVIFKENGINNPLHKGYTVNISVGGICMNTNKLIINNKNLEFNIMLDNTYLKVTGDILSNPKVGAMGVYNYRVKFNSIDSEQEKLLYNYILERQKNEIQKNNNLKDN